MMMTKPFLYIDPLKQGLKLGGKMILSRVITVFIHRSIKTRIETCLPILFQFDR